MFIYIKYIFIFIFFISETLISYGYNESIKIYKTLVLPSTNDKGVKILPPSLFKNLNNTIIVIKDSFDLDGKTLSLDENVCIKFDGGSISNGTIKLRKSNELISTFEKQCFYDVKFTGTYNKVFPLSLVGIIADGKDKSNLLANLSDMIYTNKNSIYCVFNQLSISGNIRCDKNEINLPANLDLYGIGGAKISFTSSKGDYCLSISHNTGLHDITFCNTNISYSGAILTGDCRLYDRNKNIYGGAALLKLNNIKISGKYSEYGEDFQCTGLSIIASNKDNNNFSYFTNIQSDILRIVNTKIGIEILYQNYENKKYTWGNEINMNNLYIKANTCGIKIRTEEYAKKNIIQESGHSCFGIYKFQASTPTALAFDIESVSQIIFLDFVSWDNTTWGIVRKNASIGILYDMRPFDKLLSEKTRDENGITYLSLKENNKERYKIYKGLLERKMVQYKQ